MAGYMIDTAAAIDGLTAEGIPANQARAIVRTVAQRNEEIATKSDVVALKSDIREVQAEVREVQAEVREVQAEVRGLKSGIRDLESRFDAKMTALESRLNMRIYLMAASVVAALKALEYLGI